MPGWVRPLTLGVALATLATPPRAATAQQAAASAAELAGEAGRLSETARDFTVDEQQAAGPASRPRLQRALAAV